MQKSLLAKGIEAALLTVELSFCGSREEKIYGRADEKKGREKARRSRLKFFKKLDKIVLSQRTVALGAAEKKKQIAAQKEFIKMKIYDGTYTSFPFSGTIGALLEEPLWKTAQQAKVEKKKIPVFFASDDNYVPFLDVAISSMKANSSKKYDYEVYVLHSGINRESAEKVMRLSESGFRVYFVEVAEYLTDIADFLSLRDYYTSAISYRLFIADRFPQLDKAVYLDTDTVILGDVAELYETDLGANWIGAVADGVVGANPVFCDYTKNALGIDGEKYFNSGVIVMNLKKFREFGFYKKFSALLKKYPFRVAPDQDCLNILCEGRVAYVSETWNCMPQAVTKQEAPKLVHYNLAQKPWHYTDIPYQEYFWKYAEKSAFYEEICAHLDGFTPEMAQKDVEGGKNLLALAKREAESEENYFRVFGKKEKGNGGFLRNDRRF